MSTQAYDDGYNGLLRPEPTLPAESYLEEEAFKRDLQTIWYRQWIYVCRAEAIAEPGSYRVQPVGDQEIIVLRDDEGKLQAYHNTCRHRGSILLTEPCGKLRGNSITCPYHAWSYTLQGGLKRAPTKYSQEGFDPDSKSLFSVAIENWRGFVFINLDPENAPALTEAMDMKGRARQASSLPAIMCAIFKTSSTCSGITMLVPICFLVPARDA